MNLLKRKIEERIWQKNNKVTDQDLQVRMLMNKIDIENKNRQHLLKSK